MGGGSGGGISSSDIRRLEEQAKRRLAEAKNDVSRHVFISFYHEDLDEVNLLRGQAKNKYVDLKFDDHSVKVPFDSANAEYIKRLIREKIDRCSVTMVFLTEKTASSKWVNWEIEESINRGKGVIGIYAGNKPPVNIPIALKKNGYKIVKWGHAIMMKAIEEASKRR